MDQWKFMCIVRDYYVYKELWESLLNDKYKMVAILMASILTTDAEIVM